MAGLVKENSVDAALSSMFQQAPPSPSPSPTSQQHFDDWPSPPPLQKRPSKSKLPPFTRGENPTCPSPAPPSPVAIKAPRASAAQIHGTSGANGTAPSDSSSYQVQATAKISGSDGTLGRSKAGGASSNRPQPLPSVGDTNTAPPGVGSPRQRSSSQDSPTNRFQPPHPLTRRSSQPTASSFGASNSMSIETGVLSPRRISLPSNTSSSPSPPPLISPQHAARPPYRPGAGGQTSSRSTVTTTNRGGSSSSTDGERASPSPTSTSSTFQYGMLKSAQPATAGGNTGGLPGSPTRAYNSGKFHQGATDGRPPLKHKAYSETAMQKVIPMDNAQPADPEQELQEQLAKLGESLNKLKSFSRSNSLNKKRSELSKDYQRPGDGSNQPTAPTAAAMSSTDAPANKLLSRPRRLTRTASDSDSLRYDFDLRPQNAGKSPLALDESEEDAFDTFPEENMKHRRTQTLRPKTQHRVTKREPPAECKPTASPSRGKGVQRSITFSHGNESAMRRQVYGSNNADDHHAIAALPPDLLLKRILFDKSGGTSPPGSPTVKS